MTTETPHANEDRSVARPAEFDAIIVGAGFAGLGMLHAVRALGLTAKVFDDGEDIGGTWYWNCYPGARTDSESWYYCFSFSRELLEEWDWAERYPGQAEMRRYFDFVDRKLDLRKDVQCQTKVLSAIYDEAESRWLITTDRGDRVSARYFISAMGLLSEPYIPPLDGLDSFAGPCHHTARWPQSGIDLQGKRLGIIGAGASAIQLLPVAAETADQVTLFQRTPNYVFPARNRPMNDDERRDIKNNYDTIWRKTRTHGFAMPFDSPTNRLAVDTPPQERLGIYQEQWEETGGLRFAFETFDDLLIDDDANETAGQFLRDKIREIVKDPETAELLVPDNYPLFAKRPPADHGYYEAFNRDNVSLVDAKHSEPIEAVTPAGVRTSRGEYEFDVLALATGFIPFLGALEQVDIRGRDALALQDKWDQALRTFLGMSCHGFPNMFMIVGPQIPFGNGPTLAEENIKWISACIEKMEREGHTEAEVSAEAEQSWADETNEVVNSTVVRHGSHITSWIAGTNIAGRAQNTLIYMGGADNYFARIHKAIENGFPEMAFSGAAQPGSAQRRTSA